MFLLFAAIVFGSTISYAYATPKKQLDQILHIETAPQSNEIDLFMLGFFNLNNRTDHDKFWQQGLSLCACYETPIYLKTTSGVDTLQLLEGNNLILNPLNQYDNYGPLIQLAAAADDVNVIVLDQPILDINSPDTRLCYDGDGPGGNEPQIFFTGDPNLTSLAYGIDVLASQDTTQTFNKDTLITNSGFNYHPADSSVVVDVNSVSILLNAIAGGACLPCLALPLNILNWTVAPACNGVTVSWEAEDALGAVFYIQYSEDGINYETVGQVADHKGHEFFHDIRSSGTRYYRIVAHSLDGSQQLTAWKSSLQTCIDQNNDKQVKVWGTKSIGQSVIINGFEENIQLVAEIYNISGQRLLSKSFTSDSGIKLVFSEQELSDLPDNGYYSIVIQNGTTTFSAKLLR